MKLFELPLLADENIHPLVIRDLATRGRDICSVFDRGLQGRGDTEVLREAHREQRVVMTHDSDFGQLAVQHGEAFTGILYLKPGHLPYPRVAAMIVALESHDLEVTPPFIAVIQETAGTVRIRLRPMPVSRQTDKEKTGEAD